MKFIHCADIHLDSKMETNLTREQAKERRNEMLETFSDMVSYASTHQIRGIIIAGDLFDTPEVEQVKIKRRVAEIIRNHPEMDFLYLRGNHDRAGFLSDKSERPENLRLFSDTWTTYNYGNIAITGRELTRGAGVRVYDELLLRKDDVNIVVLHGQDSQYENRDNAEVIPVRALSGRYIDYLALGHIHSYKCERLDKRGVYCYSGCPEGRGFDECGEKGFIEITIDEQTVCHEFHPFAKRTLHEVNVILDECERESEILTAILEQIDKIPKKDLVKVILCGEVAPDVEIDIPYYLRKLEGRFYFVKMTDETRVKITYADYTNEISLKGEFVRGVWNSSLPEGQKEKVILTGIKALMGREMNL